MAKAELKQTLGRKKMIPLVMALGKRIIDSLGFVEKINSMVVWDKTQWKTSPGGLLKALVLSTFADIRTPLTRLEDRLAGVDLEYLIGEGWEARNVNSFSVGRALQRLGEADCDGIYETLALSAVQMNDIPMRRLHSDTTTVSFYGEYDMDRLDLTEEEKAELLHIEKGYNKDGKPGCKQAVVGQIVNEAGIPVVSRAIDGSACDAGWNEEAIRYMASIQREGFSSGVYVADCKLVNGKLIPRMMEGETPLKFVSRCPASFEDKLESRTIEKAYAEGGWDDFGKLAGGEKSASYRGVSTTETVCGYPMRLVTVESSALMEKAGEAVEKERQKLLPLTRSLEKKTFACYADATAEILALADSRQARLFTIKARVDRTVREKWPRGRRKADTVPEISETYGITIEGVDRDEAACEEFIRKESCFVLISSVLEGMDGRELLATYKGQQIVENSFRMLKHPQLATAIYLNSTFRVKALTMILSFSLLIRAIIQHRLREGLAKYKEENPGGKLRVGWNGRELTNPTYRLLYEHSYDCYFEKEGLGRYSFEWPYVESKERVGTLLRLMGYDVLDLID